MFLQFVAGRAETIQRDQPADDIPGGCDFVCRRARSAGRVFAVHGESEAVDEFTRWEGPDPEKGGCRRDAGAQRGDFEDGVRTDSRDRHAVPGEFCAARTAARSVGPLLREKVGQKKGLRLRVLPDRWRRTDEEARDGKEGVQRLFQCAHECCAAKHWSVLKRDCRLDGGVGDRADGAVAVRGIRVSVMDVTDLRRAHEQGQQDAEQGESLGPTAAVSRNFNPSGPVNCHSGGHDRLERKTGCTLLGRFAHRNVSPKRVQFERSRTLRKQRF
jgi:hypothetical protein